MPKYNRTFDLTLNDVEQIETALRSRKHILSERRLALLNSEAVAETAEIDSELVEIADLLGRLHNYIASSAEGQLKGFAMSAAHHRAEAAGVGLG